MIGPEGGDYFICVGLANTLLNLKLVCARELAEPKPSSYIVMYNLNQVYWEEYREEHEISN